jgi:hypothetical protein
MREKGKNNEKKISRGLARRPGRLGDTLKSMDTVYKARAHTSLWRHCIQGKDIYILMEERELCKLSFLIKNFSIGINMSSRYQNYYTMDS